MATGRQTGFTLAEVAIAVVIVAILLAGILIPLSTQIDVRNNSDTQRALEQVKEAVVAYAVANGRLPCPADGTTPAGGTNAAGFSAGTEQYQSGAGTCVGAGAAVVAGVVPWATLGVPETDAWGRRFSYWVAPIFTDSVGANTVSTTVPSAQNPVCAPNPLPTQSSFALCSLGNMTVNNRSDGSHAAVALGSVLPVVIVSHGKNGYGAYSTGGALQPSPAAGTDEAANATHTTAATVFYSRNPTPAATACSDTTAGSAFCEFDDIVGMISAPILAARVVAAGRLP
jgi:prepilin-type N-terminal cleavage/methylation domain-containing protein